MSHVKVPCASMREQNSSVAAKNKQTNKKQPQSVSVAFMLIRIKASSSDGFNLIFFFVVVFYSDKTSKYEG